MGFNNSKMGQLRYLVVFSAVLNSIYAFSIIHIIRRTRINLSTCQPVFNKSSGKDYCKGSLVETQVHIVLLRARTWKQSPFTPVFQRLNEVARGSPICYLSARLMKIRHATVAFVRSLCTSWNLSAALERATSQEITDRSWSWQDTNKRTVRRKH